MKYNTKCVSVLSSENFIILSKYTHIQVAFMKFRSYDLSLFRISTCKILMCIQNKRLY